MVQLKYLALDVMYDSFEFHNNNNWTKDKTSYID